MPNPNYVKGRRKEFKVVNQEKEIGNLAFRSAGSHSPIDVVSIDVENRIIRFIQCKPDSMPESQKKKLEQTMVSLNNRFDCLFEVV